MDIWSILKTEPTRDKDALKKAYRKVLVMVHPEDDPEGFQRLRKAYEEALDLAALPEEKLWEEAVRETKEDPEGHSTADEQEVPDDTPRGMIRKTMQEIYASFFRRVDIREWEELFLLPYMASVDTAEEAMYTLLDFILEHYRLSHQVFRLIVAQYDLTERVEDLSSRYPLRFIDYILANATYSDVVDHTKFTGPADYDYDKLLDTATSFSRALKAGNREEAERLLPMLKDIPVRNPELDIMLFRYLWQFEGEEAAEKIIAEVEREYPEDPAVLINRGDILLRKGDTDGAEQYFRKAIEKTGETRVLRSRLGELANARGDYETARDIFYRLLQDEPYEGFYREQAMIACEAIAEEKRKALTETPDSKRLRIELAAALYQSYHFGDGIRELRKISSPEGVLSATYHNYLGRCLLSLRKAEEAEPEIRMWIDAIRNISPENEEEEAVEVRKKLGYAITMLSVSLMMQHRYSEAREQLESALSMKHEEYIVTLEEKCSLEYESGNYAEGIRAAVELEKRCPMNYHASLIRAKCSYRLRLFQETVNYANRAIAAYAFYPEPYLVLAKVALKQKNYEGAEAIATGYQRIHPESDTVRVIRAKIAVEKNRDWNSAKNLLEVVKDHLEVDDTDVSEPESIYLMLGDVYKELEDPHQALREYEHALKEDPENALVLERLGDTHRRLLHYEDALGYFQRQAAQEPGERVLLNQSYCLMQLGRYRQAKEKAMESVGFIRKESPVRLVAGKLLISLNCPGEALETVSFLGGDLSESDQRELLMIRVRGLIRQKKYEEAEELILSVRESDQYTAVRRLHAELLVRSGRFAEARKMIEDLIRGGGEGKEIYDLLCECYYYSGDEDGLVRTIREAEADEKERQSGSMLTGYPYELRGRIMLQNREYKAAEESFRQASDRNPGKRFRYLGYMAECAARQFGGKTRVQRYITMLEQTGNVGFYLWESKIRLAQGLRAGRVYDRAERILDEVTRELPWDGELNELVSEAYEELGWLMLSMKEKKKALLSFETAGASRGSDLLLGEMIKRLRNDSRN